MSRVLALLAVTLCVALPLKAQTFEVLGNYDAGTKKYSGFQDLYLASDDGSVVLGDQWLPDGQRDTAPSLLIGTTTLRLGELEDKPVFDLSGDGQMMVGAFARSGCGRTDSPVSNCRGFYTYKWADSTYQVLSFPNFGSVWSVSGGALISADGTVVVGTIRATYMVDGGGTRTETGFYRWTNGVRETLESYSSEDPLGDSRLFTVHGISASGQTLGGSGFTNGKDQIVRYAGGTLTGMGLLAGDTSSYPGSISPISADGTVLVGRSTGGQPFLEPVRWQGGALASLGFSAAFGEASGGEAHGVSRDGSVVVGKESNVDAATNSTWTFPTLWTASNGMRPLLQVFAGYGFNLTGMDLRRGGDRWTVNDLSADLVLVGRAFKEEASLFGGYQVAWRARLDPPAEDIVINDTGDTSDADADDGVCDVDLTMAEAQCTLRAAIEEANRRAGRDSVSFKLTGTAPFTITAATSLPASSGPIVLDAMTQPGYKGTPLVEVKGTSGAFGLVLEGGTSAVRGLSIGGFKGAGIRIKGGLGSRVEACFIGLGADGSTAVPNQDGIVVEGSRDNVIGHELAARVNLIGSNSRFGIHVTGTGASGNRVIQNVIGMQVGNAALAANDSTAILISGDAKNTEIGSSTAINRIVGDLGIEIRDLGAAGGSPDGTKVRGNVLGLTLDGAAPLGEMDQGILVTGASALRGVSGVQIGGLETGEKNVVVADLGIAIRGARSSGASVQGNVLGLLLTGEIARTDMLLIGVLVARANETVVVGNTIGGFQVGTVLAGDGNAFGLNTVGLDLAGEEARPNTVGVWVPGAYTDSQGTTDVGDQNNIGSLELPNVISGNTSQGVQIGALLDLSSRSSTRLASQLRRVAGRSASSQMRSSKHEAPVTGANENLLRFNRIGTNAAGTAQIGNGRGDEIEDVFAGVNVGVGTGNRVLGNLISGNGGGIQVEPTDGETVGTLIAGNVIGGSMTEGETIPNQFGGIEVQQAVGTRIVAAPIVEGGPAVENEIVGNGTVGIRLVSGENTEIRGNRFEKNERHAIFHFPGTDFADFPTGLSASATPDKASFQLTPSHTGDIDVYVSLSCTDGYADGTYVMTVPADADTEKVIEIPYDNLPGGGPDGAIGAYLAATQTPFAAGSTTSEFSDCVQITSPSDVASAAVTNGQTGTVLTEPGIAVNVTTNPQRLADASSKAAGTLVASRLGPAPPSGGPFEGSATTPSGSTLTPDVVSSNRHWTLRSHELAGVTYSVCLDTDGVGGITDAGQLVVVHRETGQEPWTPYASTLDGTTLCAEGLTAWGQIGIGADGSVNPVASEPDELAAPSALAISAYPNPVRGTLTVRWTLPETGPADLRVFDALGREVDVLLASSTVPAGAHQAEWDASGAAPGVYVVRLESGGTSIVRRLTVVR